MGGDLRAACELGPQPYHVLPGLDLLPPQDVALLLPARITGDTELQRHDYSTTNIWGMAIAKFFTVVSAEAYSFSSVSLILSLCLRLFFISFSQCCSPLNLN